MNLNEECLLQFLQSSPSPKDESSGDDVSPDSLVKEMNRVHRRNQFVSFPPAILIRRISN